MSQCLFSAGANVGGVPPQMVYGSGSGAMATDRRITKVTEVTICPRRLPGVRAVRYYDVPVPGRAHDVSPVGTE